MEKQEQMNNLFSLALCQHSSHLEDALFVRYQVFVQEQKIAMCHERDEHDTLAGQADHIIAYKQTIPVATGRMRIINGVGKLERICVLKSYRHYGLGRRIIHFLEEMIRKKGVVYVKIHGQIQAKRFYEKLGYQRCSDEFLEEEIPHFLFQKHLLT